MKIKKFKKELSVAIAESIVNSNYHFSIELKKENLKGSQVNFSSTRTLLVKVVSKKLKLSDFLIPSTFKFPLSIKLFKDSSGVEDYLSNYNKKESAIVFAKLNFVCLKSSNILLLSKLKALNSFNTLDKLLSSGLLILRLLNATKKGA
jgi:hypothetical protein